MLALNGGSPLRDTPFPSWPVYGSAEEEELLGVLHSGRWFLDQSIEQFERDFASFQQAKYGIATSNGTTALQVALDSIGIRPGEKLHETLVNEYEMQRVTEEELFYAIHPEYRLPEHRTEQTLGIEYTSANTCQLDSPADIEPLLDQRGTLVTDRTEGASLGCGGREEVASLRSSSR